jgi:hypothetical protein
LGPPAFQLIVLDLEFGKAAARQATAPGELRRLLIFFVDSEPNLLGNDTFTGATIVSLIGSFAPKDPRAICKIGFCWPWVWTD